MTLVPCSFIQCAEVLCFGFIARVSLLFLFFGKQLHDALAFVFVRSLLKQLAVMFYVLAPDESEQEPYLLELNGPGRL